MELNLKPSEKIAVQNISQYLFEAQVQMHIVHLQAFNKSLELHLSLKALYTSLGDLNDDLAEKSFPKTGLLLDYKSITIKNNFWPLPYITELLDKVEKQRESVKTPYIQQIVDNVIEAIAHSIYKITNLQ